MIFFKKKTVTLSDLIPKGYVDIHSHLLPGIDDGSKNIYQTTKLVKMLNEIGVEHFITTPHVMDDVWPNTTDRINNKLIETANLLKTFKINFSSFSAAAEYMIDDLFLKRLQKNDLLTIGEDYLLVEMSTFNPPINILEIIFEMKLAGYKPILAHPERYGYYFNKYKMYNDLKKAGCFFQVNLLSLTDYYGAQVQDTAFKLLSDNLIDFTGTDAHNERQINKLKDLIPNKEVNQIEKCLSANSIFCTS
ncbi:tyrosine-protein phosphatase [Spongiivirga citrea]|uniref:protein-tyrosine-phosphatase n=1 Tax=Spongiivirga citrea TaxID=1481457 RepID=A0A6M0CG40_9FLAO|nr:CpsB/CapC family capsule biosynthesis tyrosine phosphatase [Spongiivirga citrea]NER16866.1 histidinol phosphatase [Spongiivirga citrea]